MRKRISRRDFVRSAAAGVASGAIGLASARAAGKQASRPNILWIMTDQQQQHAVGAYGNPIIRNPNLDGLARNGMRFNNACIAGYPCSPSRASLLTGLYPHTHGVIINDLNLDPKLPTIASELTKAGYDTCWMGKWHVAGRRVAVRDDRGKPIGFEPRKIPPTGPTRAGFTSCVDPHSDYVEYLKRHGLDEPIPGEKVRGGHHTVIRDGHSVIPEEHFISSFLRKKAVEYLEKQKDSGKPFFLGVSFPGPHRPMTPPQPWDKMYRIEDMKLPANHLDDLKNKPRETQQRSRYYMLNKTKEELEALDKHPVYPNEFWDLFRRGSFGDREFKDLMAHYYGFVSLIDKQIGKILEALDRLGMSGNTIVLFTTDHGDNLGSHGFIFKNLTMYDELMRVPLIVRLPGRISPNVESNALVSNIDLMPTLLDLAGVPVPEGVQGRSFRPVLEGKSDRHRDLTMSFIMAPKAQIRMIRTGDRKFCLNWLPRQVDELYDLASDPGEMRNLAVEPEHAREADEMRERLFAAMRDAGDPWLEDAKSYSKLQPFYPEEINFDFDRREELMCWRAARGLSRLRIEDGKLVGSIVCPGYMVCNLDSPVDAGDYPALQIRMKTTAGTRSQFYWTTEGDPKWNEEKQISFPIQGDGNFHTYTIEVGKHPLWRGKKIRAVRLNPVRRAGVEKRKGLEAEFEIDFIRPLRSQ